MEKERSKGKRQKKQTGEMIGAFFSPWGKNSRLSPMAVILGMVVRRKGRKGENNSFGLLGQKTGLGICKKGVQNGIDSRRGE